MGISISTATTVFGPIRFQIVKTDAAVAVGPAGAIMYVIDNGDGTASLRIKAGTSTTPLDLAVDFGGGVLVP